jgi:sodium/hydrogen exchanger 8
MAAMLGVIVALLVVDAQGKTVEEDEIADDYHPTTVLLFTVLILLLTFLSYWLEKTKNPWVSESGAAMILGLLLGGILKAASASKLKRASFTDNFFFDILLPPIILEAGYSLEKRKFFKNLGTILSLAIIGTVIATFVSGWMFAKMYQNLSDTECFVYAALISAVDPVATLSVFKKVNAPDMLFNVVFGESVLNDAVAIIIYQIFLGIADSGTGLTASNMAMALVKLLGIGIGSMLMAALVSLGTSFALKKADIQMMEHPNPMYEVSAILMTNYICYLLADLLELSGIVALFFAGMMTSHYQVHNVSTHARMALGTMLHTAAFIAENFIFLYLGIAVTAYHTDFEWDGSFMLLNLFVLLIARACNVFPIIFIANRFRKQPIPPKMMFMIWFAGLRGAIAFALALTYHGPGERLIKGSTLFVVLFTTLVLGTATGPLLKFFDLSEVRPSLRNYGLISSSPHLICQDKSKNVKKNDKNAPLTQSLIEETAEEGAGAGGGEGGGAQVTPPSHRFNSRQAGGGKVVGGAHWDEQEEAEVPGTGWWSRFDERYMKVQLFPLIISPPSAYVHVCLLAS